MLASARMFADETVVPVLDSRPRKDEAGYFRAMARDDRPWGRTNRRRWFPAAPGRGQAHAKALLGSFAASCSATDIRPTRSLSGPGRPRRP